MQHGVYGLGRLQGSPGLAHARALGEVPDEISDSENWVQWVTNNAIPDRVSNYVAGQIIEGEEILHTWFVALDELRQLPITDEGQTFISEQRHQYLTAFQRHNTMKFWAMLVGPLRDRLLGKVKPPSLSVLRASKAEPSGLAQAIGFDPFAPGAVTEFVQQYLQDKLLAAARAEGAVLDGFRGPGLGRISIVSSGSLGGFPAIPAAGIVAIALAGIFVAYVAVIQGARLARDLSRNSLISRTMELEAAKKLPPGSTARAAAAADAREADGNKASPDALSSLGTIALGVGGLLALVLIGPPIISALTARRAAAAT